MGSRPVPLGGNVNERWPQSRPTYLSVVPVATGALAARAHMHDALVVHPNHQRAFSHDVAHLVHHLHHLGVGRIALLVTWPSLPMIVT
jgi:hypothetical protein